MAKDLTSAIAALKSARTDAAEKTAAQAAAEKTLAEAKAARTLAVTCMDDAQRTVDTLISDMTKPAGV